MTLGPNDKTFSPDDLLGIQCDLAGRRASVPFAFFSSFKIAISPSSHDAVLPREEPDFTDVRTGRRQRTAAFRRAAFRAPTEVTEDYSGRPVEVQANDCAAVGAPQGPQAESEADPDGVAVSGDGDPGLSPPL
jgi:hypothetical protein